MHIDLIAYRQALYPLEAIATLSDAEILERMSQDPAGCEFVIQKLGGRLQSIHSYEGAIRRYLEQAEPIMIRLSDLLNRYHRQQSGVAA